MGCGGSTARASTPVGVQNTRPHNENGRAGSAPVNGTQGESANCVAKLYNTHVLYLLATLKVKYCRVTNQIVYHNIFDLVVATNPVTLVTLYTSPVASFTKTIVPTLIEEIDAPRTWMTQQTS